MPFGLFKSRKSKESYHDSPSLYRAGSQTSGKLRKSSTLTRHPQQPSIAEEYAPPRPIRLTDGPLIHRPDSGVPFEIDPTHHPPPQLFSPELPGIQHDGGRYPAPYARKRAPELESLYTGQRSVATEADPMVSKYISGVPTVGRTPISTVPSRTWSPIPSVHREPSTLTRHQIDEEEEWNETPDRSYMQHAPSINSEAIPVQPRFANYADSVHNPRLTQLKKNQGPPPGSMYAPSMQRSARAPSIAPPFMGTAASHRSYQAPSIVAPSVAGSMMRAPSRQAPSHHVRSERFAPSTAGSARRGAPSHRSGQPSYGRPNESFQPTIFEADSDQSDISGEAPDFVHYIIPPGVNLVFQDKDGNDIVSINKQGLVRPSRNHPLRNIPILIHDEFGQKVFQSDGVRESAVLATRPISIVLNGNGSQAASQGRKPTRTSSKTIKIDTRGRQHTIKTPAFSANPTNAIPIPRSVASRVSRQSHR